VGGIYCRSMHAPENRLGEDVAWDLSSLTGTVDVAKGVTELFDRADTLVGDLQAARGTLASVSPADFAAVMRKVAEILTLVARAGTRAELEYVTDIADEKRGAIMAGARERSTRIATRMLFIELEWAAMTDEAAAAVIGDPALSFCKHHLTVMRATRPHLLSEPEERVLAEKSVTGTAAWTRLYEEQLSSVQVVIGSEEPMPLDAALSRLQSPSRSTREAAATAITAALAPGLRTRAYIYNTLLADKSTDDRMRTYSTWVSSRNLANQASDDAVKALVDAVTARNDIPQRWYKLKASLMGLDQLTFWDRNAMLSIEPPTVPSQGASGLSANPTDPIAWSEAKSIVLDAYHSFSPELGSAAKEFFDNPWIDVPVRAAKQGGAFCAPTVPGLNPFLLLNYSGTRQEVLTLAHEMGHGIHFLLSGQNQSIFELSMPLTVAETASVFGETVTFGRLLDAETDPYRRLSLLAGNVDGQIATVFRQVAMWRFEDLCHRQRRDQGEMSVDAIGSNWMKTQNELFGGTVDATGYESWWSYIPHFVHVPGYVYAYAFGQLLALSVYQRYLETGPSFVPDYIDLLKAGGSRSPEGLAAMVGCDLRDPSFWAAGLDLVDRTLKEAEEAAAIVASLT
jgi:oligoendopeptidase F